MVKPISLRLRNAEILAQARATLIRAGRGDALERAHTAAVMRKARATVARAKEENRLKRCAVLRAQKRLLPSARPMRLKKKSPTSLTASAGSACGTLS